MPRKRPTGAGYQLHRLIRRFTGQGFRAGCECKAMIRAMNQNGPAWCREHVSEIVDKMRAELQNRGLWRFVARIPGIDAPMEWLVEVAIRRAERDAQQTGT